MTHYPQNPPYSKTWLLFLSLVTIGAFTALIAAGLK